MAKDKKEEKVVKTDFHDGKDVTNTKLEDTHNADHSSNTKVGDSHAA